MRPGRRARLPAAGLITILKLKGRRLQSVDPHRGQEPRKDAAYIKVLDRDLTRPY